MFRTIAVISAVSVLAACAPKSPAHLFGLLPTKVDYKESVIGFVDLLKNAPDEQLYSLIEDHQPQTLKMSLINQQDVADGMFAYYHLRNATVHEMVAFNRQHPERLKGVSRVCALGTHIPIKRKGFHLTAVYHYPLISDGNRFGTDYFSHCRWFVVVEK